jgi:hypothetical protein
VAEIGDEALPLPVLRDLLDWLNAQQTPGIIIGGIAASVLGRPRFTADVDVSVLVDESRWPEFLSGGEPHGFVPRLTEAIDFARRSRILLLRHDPTGINVDVALAALPFEREAIARGRSVSAGGFTLPLPTAEDLIIMKAVAHRPRDLADIEAIVDCNPHLDRRRILRWVRRFSDALEAPELLQDLQALLKSRGSRP